MTSNTNRPGVRYRLFRICRSQILLTAWLAMAIVASAGAEDATKARRSELLMQMRELAKATEVRPADSDKPTQLVTDPVFRYDDQPRKFIDATMWIWTDGVRPVACQKVEARLHQSTLQPQWGYCFTSLSAEKLAVRWSADREWRSKEAGIEFQPVPDAPAPATRDLQRKRQARELARQFSGRVLINPGANRSAELRLLSTPIYEYSDLKSKTLLGAVFGFETNGTNPDLLVLFEVRGEPGSEAWHFAPARMTTGGITLKHADKELWSAPFVSPHDGPFEAWLFFSTERRPVPGETEEAAP